MRMKSSSNSKKLSKRELLVAGPVQVGKIDLGPKKSPAAPVKARCCKKQRLLRAAAPQAEVVAEKPVVKEPVQDNVVSDKKEVKPTVGG